MYRDYNEETLTNDVGDTYEIELTLELDVDNNYGADIDGNRGCRAYCVEEEIWIIYKNDERISYDDFIEEIEKYVLDFNPETFKENLEESILKG